MKTIRGILIGIIFGLAIAVFIFTGSMLFYKGVLGDVLLIDFVKSKLSIMIPGFIVGFIVGCALDFIGEKFKSRQLKKGR